MIPTRAAPSRAARYLAAGLLVTLVLVGMLTTPGPGSGRAHAQTTTTPATEVVVEEGVVYREVEGKQLLADVYLPPTPGPHPGVLVIHGGGWVSGSRSDFGDQARMLAKAGFVAATIDYRLAPADKFPAQIEDAAAAVRWLRRQTATYGVDPAHIGALGGSAGGHLAGLLATRGRGRLDTGSRIEAAVSWSGPMDLTVGLGATGATGASGATGAAGTGPLVRNLFLGCRGKACADIERDASPIKHVDSTDAPMLLVNSTRELVPLGQAEAMDAALARAGVDHQLLALAGTAHARAYWGRARDATIAFLREHLGLSDGASGPTKPEPRATAEDSNPWWALGPALGGLIIAGLAGTWALRRTRAARGATTGEGSADNPDR